MRATRTSHLILTILNDEELKFGIVTTGQPLLEATRKQN
jgi:hypothetical protein